MTFLKTCIGNFGRAKGFATGSTGVGYQVFDSTGAVVVSRTTGSVYELGPGSGNYGASVSFPDNFHGSILWDTGVAFSSTYYASEEFNYEQNNPNVDNIWSAMQGITGSIQLIRDMTEGRWKVIGNQMIFFSKDNVTEVARFNLFDDLGVPSQDAVFERVRL